jgi:hypothetical protein
MRTSTSKTPPPAESIGARTQAGAGPLMVPQVPAEARFSPAGTMPERDRRGAIENEIAGDRARGTPVLDGLSASR